MKIACECGGEFQYYEIRSVERIHKIRKDGRIYKRYWETRDGGNFMASGLHCRSCRNSYEVDMAPDGILIRGDKL